MRPVVGSILHLRGMLVSNVWLLDGGPGDRWLVDCGHWSERVTLAFELRRAGIAPRDLTGVLLTHRHSDHAGNARWLQQEHGVKIHAHRADAEVLDGSRPRTRLERGEGSRLAAFLARFENRWPVRLTVDRVLEDGDAIAGMEVHWVPGHTEGSVFYRHATTRALLSGDMLLAAVPPLTIEQRIALPYPTFSVDLAQALASLRAFHQSGFAYAHLLSGHGRPILGDAQARAEALLAAQGLA
jgi:glyoxylase-like metal-dependent hydrolase (beta-lactamase superfamily II)